MEAINFRRLELFLSAIAHNGFRGAAEWEHMSDSGLQKQVRKLEHELGLQLFQGNGRNVCLTPMGREVATLAQGVLDEVAGLRQRLAELRSGVCGRLRIACLPVHITGFLANAIPVFEHTHPTIAVDLVITPVEQQDFQVSPAGRLLRGQVDLAMTPYQGTGIEWIEAWPAKVVVAMADHHQLRKRNSVSIEMLREWRVFAMPESIWSRQKFEEACRQIGNTLPIAGEAPAEALLALAKAGVGLAILGDDNIVDRPETPYPVLNGADGQAMMAPVNLAWRQGNAELEIVAAFIDFARTQIRALGEQ